MSRSYLYCESWFFPPTTKILNHKNQLPGHHNSQSQFGYPWQSAYSQPTVLKAQIYFVYLCSSWRRYWPFNVLWYWGVNIVTEASRRAPGQGGAVLMMVMTPWTELQPDSKHCTQSISLRKGTRVSQMETLNMFYLLIYWTQKVHNDFTFLCSLLIRDSYPDVPLFHSLLRGVIFLHDDFNRCNALWCHYWLCLTGSGGVCYRTDAVHELPSALVHFL